MADRPPTAPASASAHLIERELPLARLSQWVADLSARPSNGRCVLLHGEAGVGKTSLMQAVRAATSSKAASSEWLWGTCEPLLSPTPLGPLLDMLDALPPSLAHLLRNGRAAQELMPEMLAWLKRLTRPLVLVIDDAQWADHASLDLLRFLGRRLDGLRVLLVLSYRDDELPAGHPLLMVIAGLPPASTLRVSLQPLSEQGVVQAAQAAGRAAQGLHRLTQGNPFFVTEMLSATTPDFPASVRDAVLARARTLGAAARRVLEMLSVSPLPLAPALLAQALAVEPDAVADAVARGVACGLLGDTSDGASFRHEIARRSIEASLPAAQRRALHGQLLQALADAPATRRVHHADGAGLDDEVRRLAPLAAADAARVSAHRQATALYALALQRCTAHTPALERAALLLAFAEQSERIAALVPAREALEQALLLFRQQADRQGEGLALTRLAHLHWMAGEVAEGQRAAAAAITALRSLGQTQGLAMAYAVMAQLHLLDDTDDAARQWGTQALAVAEASGEREAQVHALSTVGAAAMASADLAAARVPLQRSLALALEQAWTEHAARAYSNLVIHSLVHRQVRDWEQQCAEALAYFQARDLDLYALRLRVRRAHGLMETGRWAEAEQELRGVLAHPDAAGMDRLQAAHLLALLDLRRGSKAARASRSYWRDMLDSRRALTPSPWFAPVARACAEAAWLLGWRDALLRVVRQALPQTAAGGEPWRWGQLAVWLRRLDVLVEAPAGPVAPPCAAELAGDLDGAAAAWLAVDNTYEAGVCLLGGDAPQLRRAWALFVQLGAEPAAAVARTRLRELGHDGGLRGSNKATRADPLGLTARERALMHELAQGLSNRDIAARWHRSVRTIEHHVEALLAKLGLRSRREVADFVDGAVAPAAAGAAAP